VDTYLDWSDNAEYKANQTVPQSCCINRTRADCAGKVLKTKDVSMIHDDVCNYRLTALVRVGKRVRSSGAYTTPDSAVSYSNRAGGSHTLHHQLLLTTWGLGPCPRKN